MSQASSSVSITMAFRGSKRYSRLVPITTAVKNIESASVSKVGNFIINHSEWLCLQVNNLIMQNLYPLTLTVII